MSYIRLVLKSNKNVNDIIRKLNLIRKNKYSFCDYFYLRKDRTSVTEDNIVIRKSANTEEYLVIHNNGDKVSSRKEFDSLKSAQNYVNDNFGDRYEYKFKINKSGSEYKNKDIRLWVEDIDGMGTTVAIKADNALSISNLFDTKQSLVISIEEYFQNMIYKIKGNITHFKYQKNILDKKGLIELSSFVINRKRYLADKKKVNMYFVIATLALLLILAVISFISNKNMFELLFGITCIALFLLIILLYVYIYFSCKKQNQKYISGTIDINDKLISESHGMEGREYKIEDIKGIYVGKYSIFILVKNTPLFFYFSIDDKDKIFDIIKSNNVDIEVKELY